MFIILTHILVCILFAPPSLLLFTIFNCFLHLFMCIFYHDYTFHYRQLSRKILYDYVYVYTVCTHSYIN